jgi:hypothetical protein
MSSATFDKRLVLLGPGLTFQDNRMRNSLPPEERLAVTLKLKKPSALFLIHISFMVVLSGEDKFRISIIHYSFVYKLSKNSDD